MELPSADAIVSALETEVAGAAVETPEVPAAVPVAEAGTSDTTTTTNEELSNDGATPEDSFTKFDPSALDPDVLQQYKLMQGDYTRSKQEIAEQRKMYEAFGDPEAVQQSVEFASRLQSDPEFRTQVAQALLGQEGLTQPVNNPTAETQPDDGEYEEIELPPDVQAKLALVDELQAWRQQEIAQREQYKVQNQLLSEEAEVKSARPEWGDEDLGFVYDLALANEGSLKKAAQAAEAFESRVLARYLNQKARQPAPDPRPSSGQAPSGFTTIKDAAAAAQALIAALPE